MMPCPKCGTQSDGAFCPNCGSQVTPPAPPPAPPVQHPGYAQASPSYQPPQPGFPPQPQQPQQPGYPPQMPQQPVYPQPQQPGYPPQQYPGVQYGMQPPPKRGSSVGKWILGIIGGVVGLFVLLLIAASFLPDPEPETPTGPAASTQVSKVTITDKVDEASQKPTGAVLTTVPAKTEKIYAAATVTLKQNQRLSAQWYVNGEYVKGFDADIVADKDYTNIWASFYITYGGKPWPPGNYKVIWYVDGAAAQTAEFTVK